MRKILATMLLLPTLAFADLSTAPVPSGPTHNLVSIQVGSLANSGPDGGTRYGGIGIRYARTLLHSMIVAEDALTVEAGVFSYNVVNHMGIGDIYQVLPVNAVAQYSYLLEDGITTYAYAGGMQNFCFTQRAPTGAVADTSGLSTFEPAFGLGISLNFKGIIARADIGTDIIGAGLAYAF